MSRLRLWWDHILRRSCVWRNGDRSTCWHVEEARR